MEQHNIDMTSPEIGTLWKYYLQSTSVLCIFKHMLQYIQDSEIKPLLDEQQYLLQTYIDEIKKIFNQENFPVPKGFSDDDVDFSAPALYSDLYGLSFVYRFNQMSFSDFATTVTKMARKDVVDFMYKCTESSGNLYLKALDLMLSKGIYDRPPKMSYPDKVDYMDRQQSLLGMWFSDKRPLNALELGEIFYIIERNYIGMLLLMGFIQVVKDKELKEFLIRGKDLAQKQIDIFNKILKDEEHLGNIPVSMEVTNSTISPFSDKLIMFLVSTTITTGLYLCAYAMSVSLRKDLTARYSLIMADIAKYGEEGLKIMLERGWMEQPPQAFDRVALYKKK